MSDNYSFRWGVDLFDNKHTQIPNWVLAYYHRVGVTNTEMMFITHLASFKHETASGKANPSLTKTLRERMGYKSNQGIINVQNGLVEKGLLIVHKSQGRRSVYDFAPFSKKVVRIAMLEQLENEDKDPSTKLDGGSSTKLDESRQQNLTRKEEVKEKVKEISKKSPSDPVEAPDDFADLTSPKFAFVTKPEINGESLSLTESEIAHLRTLGKFPGSELPSVYDIIQEIKTVWEIRNPTEELAIALFLKAIRTKRPAFAIPKNQGVRNDWVKSIRGHLQDYLVDDLGDLYQLAITKLDQAGMTFSRPGSLTKTLPDVSSQQVPTQEKFDLSQHKIVSPEPIKNPVKPTLTPTQIDEKFREVREAMKNAKD